MSNLTDETAEAFVTSDPVELQVAQGILEDAGIEVAVRDLHMSAYPFSLGLLGESRLAVSVWAEAEARQLLTEALEDGALGGTVSGESR